MGRMGAEEVADLRSRKGYVLALQWLLVAAVAAWGGTTGGWRAAPSVFWTLIVLSAAGNIALMRMPLSYFHRPVHWMQLFIADTMFVGAAIYCVVGFDSEVYLPYFLIVLIAALTRGLARILAVIAVIVVISGIYVYLVWREGGAGPLEPAYLIRLPFFLAIALFTSYLANSARLQQEAQEASRALGEQVRSLQQLAAGVAHEVRNPLTAINNSLQVLIRRLPSGGEERTIAGEALAQVERVTRIVQKTLEVARPVRLQAAWIDLNECLEQALRDAAAACPEGKVKVTRQLASGSLTMWGDAVLLGQALVNVLRNALEAMPGGGALDVRSAVRMVGGTERVSVRIKDDGPGIPPHQFERLYQPFYTTKRRGTGLGLWLARKYVRAHGGDLVVDSRPGAGTEVRIVLPALGPRPIAIGEEVDDAETSPRS